MLKWFAALAVAVIAAGAAHAQDNVPHARVSAVTERAAVAPGDQFLVGVKLDLDDTWHVYWKNAGDSGLPPEVKWTTADGVTMGPFMWPAPEAIPLATLMNYGYEKQVIFPVQVTLPKSLKVGETVSIKGHVDYLICQDICIPEKADIALDLPVEATLRTDDAGSAAITGYIAQLPQPITGAATIERTATGFRVGAADTDLAAAAKDGAGIHYFPEGPEIEHIAKQVFKRGDNGVSVELKASDFAKPGDQALNGVIVVQAKDGSRKAWQVDAKPGAIGAGLSDTIVKASAGGGSVAGNGGGGTPVAGLDGIALLSVLGFAFIGGLVLNLMPCVLPVLSIKAAGLVHTAHDPKAARADGLAYLAGVLVCFVAFGAVLVALRAAGEQAGLGFQLQYPPVVAAFSLLVFAVGLNLLGVFEIGSSLMGVGSGLASKGGTTGAFFTGLLAAFVGAPCVGPFMAAPVGIALAQPAPIVIGVFAVIGLGLAAPFVALSFTPALARALPKPGRWMETFRQVLAFPMFLTVIWLLWVLAGQAGSDGVLLVIIGATVLSFGIWLGKRIGGKVPGRVVAALIILAALIGPTVLSANMKPPTGGQTLAAEAGAEAWSPELVEQYRSEGRVIFVDFTARWCATCQVNKHVALDSEQARKAFAESNVAFLVADWTNRDSVIADELAKHSRAGVPLYLVYPAGGGEPVVLPQILSPGLVAKAVKDAAGSAAASNVGSQKGDRT